MVEDEMEPDGVDAITNCRLTGSEVAMSFRYPIEHVNLSSHLITNPEEIFAWRNGLHVNSTIPEFRRLPHTNSSFLEMLWQACGIENDLLSSRSIPTHCFSLRESDKIDASFGPKQDRAEDGALLSCVVGPR